MTSIPRALLKAAVSQMHPRMLLLTLLPLVVTAILWAGVIWSGWEPAVNAIQRFLSDSSFSVWLQRAAAQVGLDQYVWHWQVFAAPVLVALLLVPGIVLSVVFVTGVIAAPFAVRHVARDYPQVRMRSGSGFLASMANALWASIAFTLLWLVTLPLWLIPPLGLVVPLVLWGWLNYRVMTFDALAEHADPDERVCIMHTRRWELLALGIVVAALGVVPTLIWVGGVFVFVFFAPFALVTLWLYVLIFTYSALVFAHFGLEALARLRGAELQPSDPT